MSKNSRKLGTSNENTVGAVLSCWFTGEASGTRGGRVFHRQQGSGGDRGFRGDLKTPDSLFLHIECKDIQGWELTDILRSVYENNPNDQRSVINWWKQCASDAKKRAIEDFESERPKWLIFTRNNQPQYLMIEHREWNRLNFTSDNRRIYRGRYVIVSTELGSVVVLLLDAFLASFKPRDVVVWSGGFQSDGRDSKEEVHKPKLRVRGT